MRWIALVVVAACSSLEPTAPPSAPPPAAPPWTLTASDGSGLELVRVDARGVVEGPLAFTELHLYFRNPEARVREGTFAIALPPGAAVSRFATEHAAQWHEAEVVPKELARRAYDDFLHRRQDPALLEQAPGNQFVGRVFPIAARADVHLVIAFSQELAGERYILPLRGLPRIAQLDVRIDAATRDGRRAHELHQRGWQPDRDLAVEPSPLAAVGTGTIVAAAVPIGGAVQAEPAPRGISLLVDTSASRGLGFQRYVDAVQALVGALRARYGDDLALEVLAFDQQLAPIFAGRAADYRDGALRLRGAAGASDLAQALAHRPRHARVALVTDAVVTAGATGPALLAAIGALHLDRVDVVLAGGIRDVRLAASLARTGARPGDVLDLDGGAPAVAEGLGRAVLADVAIRVLGAMWSYPARLPSVRAGGTAVVYARLAKPADAIEIEVGGVVQRLAVAPVTVVLVERAHQRAEIAELEAQLEAAPSAELRERIAAQSVAARVVSSQTAMLVLESDADYARYGIDRRALADILVVEPRGLVRAPRTYVAAAEPVRDEPEDDPTTEMTLEEGHSGKRDAGHYQLRTAADLQLSREEAIELARTSGVLAATGRGDGFAALTGTADISSGFDDSNVYGVVRQDDPPPPEQLAIAPPRDEGAPPLTGRLAEVMQLIRDKRLADARALALRWRAEAPGDVLAVIALGEALEALGDRGGAARVYGSIIDLHPARADLRRFAGERLERTGDPGRALAIDTYRRAVADRPDHISGHRLLAYALERAGDHAGAFAAILAGVDQLARRRGPAGADRVLADDAGILGAAYAAHGGWRAQIELALALRLLGIATKPSTRFISYWETDANDVDLHIRDARGGHAWYGDRKLRSGGELYADITTGYGPECFAIAGAASTGPYRLSLHYFSQGPMGYGMGLLQIQRFDGKGGLSFDDRPYVIMSDRAYVELGATE